MGTEANSAEYGCLLYTAGDVAKLLGVSERHVWACHSKGLLGPRPISLGRSRRWRANELKAWLAAGAPARGEWEKEWPLHDGLKCVANAATEKSRG